MFLTLKAHAAAHRGAPTTPERSPSPVRSQGETNVELPPEQHLSSSSNSALHNNTDRTTAEFNSIVVVYNMMPNIVNNARAFTQVRNSHLLPSCQLTLHPASTKQPTPPSFPCNPRDLINLHVFQPQAPGEGPALPPGPFRTLPCSLARQSTVEARGAPGSHPPSGAGD